jgi:hypothetical protein
MDTGTEFFHTRGTKIAKQSLAATLAKKQLVKKPGQGTHAPDATKSFFSYNLSVTALRLYSVMALLRYSVAALLRYCVRNLFVGSLRRSATNYNSIGKTCATPATSSP